MLASGICTTALHCGQVARRPAAVAGTFNARPQLVQENSIEGVGSEEGVVLMRVIDGLAFKRGGRRGGTAGRRFVSFTD